MPEDVKLSIGANATPFKQAMAQVQATAKATGESLGVEFDRGAVRAENRVVHALKNMFAELGKRKTQFLPQAP